MKRVWDLPTRVFHWALAASFGLAFVSGEEPSAGAWHVAVGAGVGALLLFRVGWGLVGERWSRWSAFGQEPGHDKKASVSVVAALIALVGIVATGVVVLGAEEARGPLAGWTTVGWGVAVHEAHGWLAWGVVAWLVVHLAGVARKSWATQQNLVRGMVDGRKDHSGADVRSRAGAAVALAVAVVAVVALSAASARSQVGPTLARSEAWDEACGECHLAYAPALLPAASWQAMLGKDEHFGESLGLDAATTKELTAFAVANAAERGLTELSVRMVEAGDGGERITETSTWKWVHEELAPEVFEREDIGSAARCGACHPDAEAGTFDGRAARVGEGT